MALGRSGSREGLSHDRERLLVLARGGQGVRPFAQGLSGQAGVAELSSQLPGAAVRLQGGVVLAERGLSACQGEECVDRCLEVARAFGHDQGFLGGCRGPVPGTARKRDLRLGVEDVGQPPVVAQRFESGAG